MTESVDVLATKWRREVAEGGTTMGRYGLAFAWGRAGRDARSWGSGRGRVLAFEEGEKPRAVLADYAVVLFQQTGGSLPAGMRTLWGIQEQILEAQCASVIDGVGAYSQVAGA